MQAFALVFPIVLLAIVTLGGYAGFLLFLTQLMPQFSAFGLGLVAVVAGVAGFFNPCAFPLLPAYLGGFFLEKTGGPMDRRAVFRAGVTAAAGVIAFNILLGLALAILGAGVGASFGITTATPNPYVRALRIVIGIALGYLGLAHLLGRGNPFAFLGHALKPSRVEVTAGRFGKFFSYGFGYTLLGIGCGGPILGSLALYAISSGGFQSVLLGFTIYTLTMAALMVLTSLLVGYSRDQLIVGLRGSVLIVQRLAGILIFSVGLYLIASSIFVREFARLLFP